MHCVAFSFVYVCQSIVLRSALTDLTREVSSSEDSFDFNETASLVPPNAKWSARIRREQFAASLQSSEEDNFHIPHRSIITSKLINGHMPCQQHSALITQAVNIISSNDNVELSQIENIDNDLKSRDSHRLLGHEEECEQNEQQNLLVEINSSSITEECPHIDGTI